MKERTGNHTLSELEKEEGREIPDCTAIEPAFCKSGVAIALVASDQYAPFVGVTIASILQNASQESTYDIVVLTADMTFRQGIQLTKMGSGKSNISIRVVSIAKLVEKLQFYTWAHFTPNTYYRLLIPDIFCHYEKVLYLDSDIVVNHDVAELYRTDISEYYLAAVRDTHIVAYCTQTPPLEQREYNKKVLRMADPEQYFQAGVALFHVKKIRADYGENYLIKRGTASKLRWLDQDLLNMLFYGKIKELPNRWNVMVNNLADVLDEYHLPENMRREYLLARDDPYIVHYVGESMPCNTETPDMGEYFWKYARQTVFYELLLQRMTIQCVNQRMTNGAAKRTFRSKAKAAIWRAASVVLPKGSKRRIYAKRLLFKLKIWKTVERSDGNETFL